MAVRSGTVMVSADAGVAENPMMAAVPATRPVIAEKDKRDRDLDIGDPSNCGQHVPSSSNRLAKRVNSGSDSPVMFYGDLMAGVPNGYLPVESVLHGGRSTTVGSAQFLGIPAIDVWIVVERTHRLEPVPHKQPGRLDQVAAGVQSQQ